MTQDEINQIIDQVAKNHRNKSFGYFTKDDIEQEVWIICLEKVANFELDRGLQKDPKKALEHWLNTVVSNRLKNFYRNKYIVPQQLHKAEYTNNLVSFNSLPTNYESVYEVDYMGLVHSKELWEYLTKHLNDVDLCLLDSLMSGEVVGSYYSNKILKKIKKLLNEYQSL